MNSQIPNSYYQNSQIPKEQIQPFVIVKTLQTKFIQFAS